MMSPSVEGGFIKEISRMLVNMVRLLANGNANHIKSGIAVFVIMFMSVTFAGGIAGAGERPDSFADQVERL